MKLSTKLKNLLLKSKKVLLNTGFLLLSSLFALSNGNTADAVRGELEQAESAEQHIADAADAIEGTVGGLTDTIENAANASSKFEAILDECAGIIDAIRKQPAD